MIVVPMYANPLQIFWGGQPPHWHWSSMVINSFHVRVPESKDQACQKGLARDASTFTAQPPTGWTTCNGQRPPTLGGRTSVWKLDFTLRFHLRQAPLPEAPLTSATLSSRRRRYPWAPASPRSATRRVGMSPTFNQPLAPHPDEPLT